MITLISEIFSESLVEKKAPTEYDLNIKFTGETLLFLCRQ